MDQRHSTLQPHRALQLQLVRQALALNRSGAAQIDPFESKGLKPVSHFIGSRVETRRFQAMGQLDSTCIETRISLDKFKG
jgi:hypothetical protein